MEAVDAVYYTYESEACPHDPVAKKSRCRVGHLKRQLYYGITQLLILCPLLPENQVYAGHDEGKYEYKPAPPHDRLEPGREILNLV